jgi:hypothetical protein
MFQYRHQEIKTGTTGSISKLDSYICYINSGKSDHLQLWLIISRLENSLQIIKNRLDNDGVQIVCLLSLKYSSLYDIKKYCNDWTFSRWVPMLAFLFLVSSWCVARCNKSACQPNLQLDAMILQLIVTPWGSGEWMDWWRYTRAIECPSRFAP